MVSDFFQCRPTPPFCGLGRDGAENMKAKREKLGHWRRFAKREKGPPAKRHRGYGNRNSSELDTAGWPNAFWMLVGREECNLVQGKCNAWLLDK